MQTLVVSYLNLFCRLGLACILKHNQKVAVALLRSIIRQNSAMIVLNRTTNLQTPNVAQTFKFLGHISFASRQHFWYLTTAQEIGRRNQTRTIPTRAVVATSTSQRAMRMPMRVPSQDRSLARANASSWTVRIFPGPIRGTNIFFRTGPGRPRRKIWKCLLTQTQAIWRTALQVWHVRSRVRVAKTQNLQANRRRAVPISRMATKPVPKDSHTRTPLCSISKSNGATFLDTTGRCDDESDNSIVSSKVEKQAVIESIGLMTTFTPVQLRVSRATRSSLSRFQIFWPLHELLWTSCRDS